MAYRPGSESTTLTASEAPRYAQLGIAQPGSGSGAAVGVVPDNLPPINVAQLIPFILTTGRILEHYNCGTMTRRTGNSEIVVQDYLSINPADAQRKSIRTGDRVRLSSARGEVELEARVTDEVKPGILYTTFNLSLIHLLRCRRPYALNILWEC